MNPSRTLLATGGENPSDVAIYSLPDFRPVTIGESAHSDWLFDLEWIDDEYLISGSRCSSVALWRFADHVTEEDCRVCPHVQWIRPMGVSSVAYPATRPVHVTKLKKFDKVRALSYNKRNGGVTAVSLNSCLCVVDLATMKQVRRIGEEGKKEGKNCVWI